MLARHIVVVLIRLLAALTLLAPIFLAVRL
jgi:hypothetical protein